MIRILLMTVDKRGEGLKGYLTIPLEVPDFDSIAKIEAALSQGRTISAQKLFYDRIEGVNVIWGRVDYQFRAANRRSIRTPRSPFAEAHNDVAEERPLEDKPESRP